VTEVERLRRADEIVQAALDGGAVELPALLDAECAGDALLRAEVESLLGYRERAKDFIETPAFALGACLFEDGDDGDGAGVEGRRIGPYRVVREIGRGGMGAVYLAERADGEFRQQVAVKVIRQTLGGDEVRRHFKRERQILASLNHPNIARLLDGGVSEDGEPFLAMEYVEGVRIDEYADAHGLSTSARLKLFRQVCAAAQYAHQNLIIHRDLKPSNILVTKDGVPKLLDFGIAKLLDSEQADSHTLTELGVMTPEYASPEQVRGESVTTASDVYSLGVVLYELLAGRRPYRIKSRKPDEIARAICTQEPEKPSEAVSRSEPPATADGLQLETRPPATAGGSDLKSLRGDLDNIVLMAMRKEPSRRYASVGQFSEDIRRHMDGLPVIARKDTFQYRSAKFIKRNKVGVAAAALVLLTLIGGIVGVAWQARAAQRQAMIAAQERDRARTEAAKAERINEFLQQMLSFSNQSVYSVAPVAQTKNVTVNQMLDEISPRIEAELADQPEVRAQILRTIASAYASQGIYDKAEKNYRSALETQTRVFGTDHAETAATMTQLGVLSLRQAKIAEAKQLLEIAVAFYRRQQARQDPAFSQAHLVTAMDFVGAARYFAGDVQSSVAILQEAVQIGETADFQGHERFVLAHAQGDLGFVLMRIGEIERAERLLRASLALFRQLSEYPPWEMGATLASLGELYNKKNQPDQALEFLLESERIYRQTLGDKNPYLAFNLQQQAVALIQQKNFTAAEPKARQQLAIYQEVMPGNKTMVALTNSVLGIVLVGNERFNEAENHLREGLQAFEQSPVKNHFIGVQAKLALSQCLLHRNRLAEAEQFALAAHAEARQNLGEQNLLVKTAAESLSKIYERQGKSK
jgi:serine/threonine-protein kinase